MATVKLSLRAISRAVASRAAGPTISQPKSSSISSRSIEMAASSSTTSTRAPDRRSSFESTLTPGRLPYRFVPDPERRLESVSRAWIVPEETPPIRFESG
ncbi:protein of unknown function [Methylorubrum extorquens]|uniref:Uncharacterized protein n=1 Tax=Methylorubrum extorquens TaxID=408 RepID=A0A2N9AZ61_METEX|nr:protein of unknown function [Methylorubrum extorquens]